MKNKIIALCLTAVLLLPLLSCVGGTGEELKDVKGIRVCGPCVEEIKEGVFFDTIVPLE